MNYNNIQLIDDLRTWQGVNNALLSDKVKGQKEKRKQTLKDAEIETRELYDLLQEYDDKVQDLVVQNRNLSYENQNLKLMGSNTGEPLIYSGDEDDFFPNEIREIIISALKNELGNMPKDSRRYAVISDILESNNHDNELEKRSRKIKQLLSSYTGMNAKLKNSLKELGFEVTEEGKHYKLIYFGDNRYTFSIAKTPSDKSRAGKNNASTINSKLY